MGDARAELGRVVEALGALRQPVSSEARLHELVAEALTTARIAHAREVDLGEHGRIDFLTAGGVGVEVKIAGARSEVLRQLHGYAQADTVRELVLFTTRATHALLVGRLNGKPLMTVHSKGWL